LNGCRRFCTVLSCKKAEEDQIRKAEGIEKRVENDRPRSESFSNLLTNFVFLGGSVLDLHDLEFFAWDGRGFVERRSRRRQWTAILLILLLFLN
jgi:hypothetical protein